MSDAASHTLPAAFCFVAIQMAFQKPKVVRKTASRTSSPKKSQDRQPLTKGGGFLSTEIAFKGLILAALKDLYGELESASYQVDVLSWDPASGEGRLRVPARSLVPVRAALTLVSSCGDIPCSITFTDVSPFLAGLACDRYLEEMG
ncbi:unnamed protein product [Sphacelaria rigidula]